MALDGAQVSDYQQPPAKKAGQSTLIEHSGFLDGLKNKAVSLGHSAGQLVDQGVKKGHELATSETAQRVKGQVVETSHQVMASPVTHRVVAEATQTGKQLAHDNVSNVSGAIAAGKNGDIVGVIRHAAPIAGEVALGPAGVAMNIARQKATDIAISQAPASQRANLEHVSRLSHGLSLQNLSLTGLAKAEVSSQVHDARRTATEAALQPHPVEHPVRSVPSSQHPVTEQSSASTSDFIQSLKAKLQAAQTGEKH